MRPATENDFAAIRDDIRELELDLKAHEVRFGNGREVMAEMKKDIEALKPKAPDWVKLLVICVGFLTATLGAHYWLIEQFNDRPTNVQIEKAFHGHSENGHASTQRDINGIRETQTEQRVLLNELRSTVAGQDRKLDAILNRMPRR